MTGIAVRLRTSRGTFTLDARIDAPGRGVTGLFGASGSGKTTLLRGIAGLDAAAHGLVRVNDSTWQDETAGIFVAPHERGVGYVSQEADLFPHLTVRDNLSFGFRRVAPSDRRLEWNEVVEWLAVPPLLDRTIDRLSGGERQRVAIARALLASPMLLLMDEPVSALDEPSRRDVLEHLERVLARLSLPVIYVSHSLSEVARLATHLVWLTDGKVGDAGSVSQVLGRLDFARWRGEEMGVVLDGEIRSHEESYRLTVVTTPLGELTIHYQRRAPGARVRVQVLARDVSLGLTAQERSSILNELTLTVTDLVDLTPSDCLVRLGREGTDAVLFARITRKSRALLALEPGRDVFARVKSVAVLD